MTGRAIYGFAVICLMLSVPAALGGFEYSLTLIIAAAAFGVGGGILKALHEIRDMMRQQKDN